MESTAKPAVNLETELTCSICTELLYQPLTLLDCLHTFCGACLKEWFSWQAQRAETAPVPPPPDAAIFTCPSCRDRVRDTKHDARVATLLDMYLQLNPDRGRTAADKEEMDGKYKKGERVMPRVRVLERSEEERRGDEEERRLLESVQRESLREAMREAGRRDRGEDRRRAHSANLRADGEREGERRRRSESRQRGAAAAAVEAMRTRQVEHQSSLRSLISSEGVGARDIEREIEEFTRQIQEEGLLDGLDLDNINLRDNDELSKRITEAYRRRYRERSRQEGGRRSNASSQSHRSELRPRAHTGDGSRPSSRHGGASRPASANNSGDERGRYPPSSSTHLDIEPARRRRTPSGGRSATVPTPVAQPEVRGVTARSQTDLAIRPAAGVIAVEARSSSSPTTVTPTRSRGDSPENRGASFSSRATAGLGITQPQASTLPEAVSDSESRSRKRTPVRPVDLAIIQTSPSTAPKTGQLSPSLASPSGTSPRRNPLPRYKEPLINCDSCSKPHIEYEVHYNCAVCHGGEWNICLDCYRKRKGCLHWLGFGKTAWERWEKLKNTGDAKWAKSPPHFLTANRYTPPKQTPGGADGRRTLTTESPLDRLQSGTFCCRCSAWTTNDGYWQCDICNEGEWGFCADCVGRGLSCTHHLLPMAYRETSTPPPLPADSHTPPASPGGSRPARKRAFLPIVPVRPCSVCRKRIPGPETRFHCHSCKSDAIIDARTGDYDICRGCYTSVIASGLISTENGPAGWRRCPRAGHRMVVEAFVRDNRGDERRELVQDLVGGRRLVVTKYEAEKGMEVWAWKDDSGNKVERLVSVDVGGSTQGANVPPSDRERFNQTAFPPDGGSAPKAVACWSWYPVEGEGDDELMFPKWAEILEVEDQNGEWFHGFYMGASGLLPAPYVKVEKPKKAEPVQEADEVEAKACRLQRLLA
ncbi:E3 ubiquitin-protein ligase [Podospora aff. communis PSN243]|uniref:E3 ubiquitin-protein ligase n=1 Tax=Podospora aff. communis PSN243 TaxID=3040156 RepID=A0AAV9H5B7_9PEZI|nr:E3 ubiquitin-protein ligase [Podospora aff. communis PSN243]